MFLMQLNCLVEVMKGRGALSIRIRHKSELAIIPNQNEYAKSMYARNEHDGLLNAGANAGHAEVSTLPSANKCLHPV